MTCACGAHICWKCMGVFGRDDIYPHMRNSHGDIYDVPEIPPAPVQIAPGVQARIAQNFEEAAHALAHALALANEQRIEQRRHREMERRRREEFQRVVDARQEELRRTEGRRGCILM
ncbi:hypothetical protein M422DRAFT_277145 [Sphaerobolus stellatus SS14]|uniref:Unplaced genomic scaffold SPHSTscaffold_1183, whole genome shotgun sequence n=2 Tax=Sphaerobolus stellatus (strain SS14) TaxID=990650 RepID=A0A0C9TKS4_SPHS4|nr:hypothetical protein M422DRAFT_277145 [Sphaerobolus stellatus SS14]